MSPVGTSVVPIKQSPRLYGYAPPNTPTVLDNLRCSGIELSLLECQRFTKSDIKTCQHLEDAGVQCGGTLCVYYTCSLYSLDVLVPTAAVCMDRSVRIIAGDGDDFYNGLDSPLDPSFYINEELAAGRLEICEEGVWRPVCIDVFDYADASVACAQLGFSRAGEIT